MVDGGQFKGVFYLSRTQIIINFKRTNFDVVEGLKI